MYTGADKNSKLLHYRVSAVHQQKVLQAPVDDEAAPSALIALSSTLKVLKSSSTSSTRTPLRAKHHHCSHTTVIKGMYPNSLPRLPHPRISQGLQAHLIL